MGSTSCMYIILFYISYSVFKLQFILREYNIILAKATMIKYSSYNTSGFDLNQPTLVFLKELFYFQYNHSLIHLIVSDQKLIYYFIQFLL